MWRQVSVRLGATTTTLTITSLFPVFAKGIKLKHRGLFQYSDIMYQPDCGAFIHPVSFIPVSVSLCVHKTLRGN